MERPRLPHEPIEVPEDTSSLGEPVEIDDAVGHGGHLIASLYNQDAQNNDHDSAKLIRMGIFAGIALAFHVRFSFLSISIFVLSTRRHNLFLFIHMYGSVNCCFIHFTLTLFTYVVLGSGCY